MTLKIPRPDAVRQEVFNKVVRKGRASAHQAGILLNVQYQTIVARIARGEIQAVRFVTNRYHISLRELVRLGLVLPSTEELRPFIQKHLTDASETEEEYD